MADGNRLEDIAPLPRVTATAWIVYDAGSDEPLAATRPTDAIPIASLVKLMTALVVVERVQPDELVTIPAAVNDLPADAARMDARAGEKWPAGELLRAMLVTSANDAAIALASHVADGDITEFVALMNERAEQLGLSSTTFGSPTGLDPPGSVSVSSPVDLVALTETVLLDPEVRAAVRQERIELRRPGGGEPVVLTNRNPLLATYAGVDGVKTGFTDAAGYMLVAHHRDEETGGELIVVTADSSSERTRARDAAALLDWARQFRTSLVLVPGGTAIGTLPVRHAGRRISVFACDDLVVSARAGQEIVREVVVPRLVTPPVAEGDEVGELRALVAGTEAAAVPICSADRVREENWLGLVRLYADEYPSAWRAGIRQVREAWRTLDERLA